MEQKRPRGYPKLKDYKPTSFMLPTSHYDKAKAERAVLFIENLRHTKGKWAGKRFWLLPWQEQIIRDIFGIVDERGKRQFRTAFVEIGKKNGSLLLRWRCIFCTRMGSHPQRSTVLRLIGSRHPSFSMWLTRWCR